MNNLKKKRRAERMKLLNYARDLFTDKRVHKCLRMPISSYVNINKSQTYKSAYFSNLVICGSIWLCPICQAKISERRRWDLMAAEKRWREEGGHTALATFTMGHKTSNHLLELRQKFSDAMSRLTSDRWWLHFKDYYGLYGTVKANEITYSFKNGWHFHAHALWFLDRKIDIAKVNQKMRERWLYCLKFVNHYGTLERCFDLRWSDDSIPTYIVKENLYDFVDIDDESQLYKTSGWTAVHEVTKTSSKAFQQEGKNSGKLKNRKKSYSYWQLLHYSVNAVGAKRQATFRNLCKEYALSTYKLHQLQYSRGLKKKFGINQESDEDLAKKGMDMSTVLIAQLTRPQWFYLERKGYSSKVLDLAAADDRGLSFIDFLQSQDADGLFDDIYLSDNCLSTLILYFTR